MKRMLHILAVVARTETGLGYGPVENLPHGHGRSQQLLLWDRVLLASKEVKEFQTGRAIGFSQKSVAIL